MLFRAGRFDGAVYVGGYAVELGLKARICRTLKWVGFPTTNAEFQGYASFRTHDFDILLHLSGRETAIKTKHLAEWSVVALWDPGARYLPIGTASAIDAQSMLRSAGIILGAL